MNRRWAIVAAIAAAAALIIAVVVVFVVRGEDPDVEPIPEARCGAGDVGSGADQASGPAPAAGQLAGSEPLSAPGGANAWKITYCSTGEDGESVQVTGQLVVPDTDPPAGGFPVIAYAPGTAGLGDQCAVSSRGVDRLPFLQDWLGAGYALVATDYAGLGTDGTPGYLVGSSEARSVLDSIRAAQNVPEANVGSRSVVVGYSQGGHSALFAGEFASEYAPELDIAGVAALAPPTNLRTLIEDLFTAQNGFGPAVELLASWSEYYGIDPSELLTERGLNEVEAAKSRCAGGFAGGPTRAFVQTLIEDAPDWVQLLEENSTGQRPVDVPVFIGQAANDALVPADVTRAALPGMCDVGTDLNFVQYPNTGHRDLLIAARGDLIEFVTDALAGDDIDIGQDCAALA